VTVEEGKGRQTVLEHVDGLQFDKGYISPYFITDVKDLTCVLEDCFILLHEKKISSLREFIPLLEKVAHAGKALLVVAEDVEGEVLPALVVNRLRGVLKVCAVKAPGFGDRRKAMLEDIAVLTGGRFISEDLGLKLENVTLEQLGRAKKVTITKDATTIVEGAGTRKDVDSRVAQIRSLVEKSTSDYDKEKLQERLAKITGGIAVVKVGGTTEAELKERKYRVDDALHATRAAVEEGIVPGGGVALIRCLPALGKLKVSGDEQAGVDIVRRALEEPLRQIVSNAGVEASVVVDDVKAATGDQGFDAKALKMVAMYEAGILDPTKVVRTALQNAASVAGLMLTTETLVTDLKDDRKPAVGALT